MPEKLQEQGAGPQAEEAREKSQAAPASEPKQDAHGGGAHGGAYTLFRELAEPVSAQEPPPDKLSPIFRKSEFSHPVNDEQKARSLAALQQQYGNRYVQRVLSPEEHAPSAPLAGVPLMRQEANGAEPRPEPAPAIEHSGGRPLDAPTQEFMGSRFQQEFSGVRVHDDAQAHRAAKELNAKAFTTGRDIYFSQGAYDPSSASGRKLLAHELTHVVQQSRGAAGVSASGFSVSHPSDPLERQAEEVSRAVMESAKAGPACQPLAPLGSIAQAHPSIQRFEGTEHEQLGNVTGVSAIDLGNGVVLSWGQLVAIAGDFYPSIETLLTDTRTADGRMRIRAALEHYGSPTVAATTLPVPTAERRAETESSFVTLALQNITHFSAGGSARETWLDYHTRALDAAIGAGLTNDAAERTRSYALEAFGQHFLTDAFSAGHVRTPRREIADWYVDVFAPRVIDHVITHLRERFVNDIYAQVARQSRAARIFEGRARDRIRNELNAMLNTALAGIGGRAGLIRWFGLFVGGGISGVIHDREGRQGVVVTSLAHPEPWHTVGDARLYEGSRESVETRTEAENAVRSARQDIDIAFDIGQGERHFRDTAPLPAQLPQTVYFGFNHSDLTDAARSTLTGASAYLVYNPGAFVSLVGHTDPIGRPNYNRDLATRRAETVSNFLTSFGVNTARVSASSRGEEMLVTTNPHQFWRNRRVELAWGERPVAASHDIGRERASQAVRRQIGPPYQAERFIPLAVPSLNQALPDWHWGRLPAALQTEISNYAIAALRPRIATALARPELNPRVVEGNTIEPRPIAEAIFNELLRDPVGFLGRAFGEGAGP